MERTEESIEMDCPAQTVYDRWSQFEDLLRLMARVKEIGQIDHTHLPRHAARQGKTKEWDAEITEQTPAEHWRSVSGAENAGTVSFQSPRPNRKLVRWMLAYDPYGVIENVGETADLTSSQAQSSVSDFEEDLSRTGIKRPAPGTVKDTVHRRN